MLNHARVLIVEDEAIIAMALECMVEDGGGSVIGCCGRIDEAMHMLDDLRDIDAAILDFRLEDGDITPVAHRLFDAKIPIVFHTASPLPIELLARGPRHRICPKPSKYGEAVEAIECLLQGGHA